MQFKVGDRVKIIAREHGHGFKIGTNVIINIVDTQSNNYRAYNIDTNNEEDYWWVEDEELELVQTTNTNNKMTTNQLMKDALKAQVDKLLKANNTVTTLEVKVELRKTDPEFYWDQATVSRMMDELAQDNTLVYSDNSNYRTYSNASNTTSVAKVSAVPTPSTQVVTKKTRAVGSSLTPSKKLSRTKALELIQNSKGRFIKVVFTKKKDGKERIMNAQYVKGQPISPLGLVRVKETSLLKQYKRDGNLDNIPSKSVIKSFNINNLKVLGIGGETYKITN